MHHEETIAETVTRGGEDFEYEYYDIEFDSHGNWTCRKFKLMGFETKMLRSLEYYE